MIRAMISLRFASALIASALLGACGKPPAAPAVETPTAPARELPPAPGEPRSAKIPAPIEKILPNGLRVIVVQRSGSPLVTAELTVLSGGEVDPQGLAGLADFTASLLTQGTKTRSAPQIAQAAEALGGTLTASAGWNATRIGITVTTPKTGAALALLADVVRNPVFAKDEVERQRSQALDSLSVSLSQPRTLAGLVAARAAYGESPYGHPRLGTPASLARIGAADLVTLHRDVFRPDNAVLIFAGDIDDETAAALAEKDFGTWRKPSDVLAKPAGDAAAKPPTGRVIVIDLPDAGQAAVAMIRQTAPRSAPDYYPGLITDAVLGGGYSARLNAEIRIKRGLSYGAYSRFDALRDGGALLASSQTKNISAAEVAALMKLEITRLGTERVATSELTARKASLIGEFSRQLETTSGLAEQFGKLVVPGISLDEINRVIASANAVTAEELKVYATKHLAPDEFSIVIVGDAKQFIDAARKAYPNLELIPVAELNLDSAALKLAPAPAPTSEQKAPG